MRSLETEETTGLLSEPAATQNAEDVEATPQKQIVYQSSDTGYWPLVISFLMIGTPLAALTGAEIFGSTLALGGVSITVISGLIGFAAISALALMAWGYVLFSDQFYIGAHLDGIAQREAKKTNFWSFIKTSGTILGLSLVISAFATWVVPMILHHKAALSLIALKNTALSAIAATAPWSTFLVGTVALTLFISALSALTGIIYQNVIKPRREAREAAGARLIQAAFRSHRARKALNLLAGHDDADSQVHSPVASELAELSPQAPLKEGRAPSVGAATEEGGTQQEALQLTEQAAVLMAAAGHDDADGQVHSPVASELAELSPQAPLEEGRSPAATEERGTQQEALQLTEQAAGHDDADGQVHFPVASEPAEGQEVEVLETGIDGLANAVEQENTTGLTPADAIPPAASLAPVAAAILGGSQSGDKTTKEAQMSTVVQYPGKASFKLEPDSTVTIHGNCSTITVSTT